MDAQRTDSAAVSIPQSPPPTAIKSYRGQLKRLQDELEAALAELRTVKEALETAKASHQDKVAELTTAVRLRDQFLAMLSHELRNPLAAVLTSAQVIGRASHDAESVALARDIIERQARHAARLLDDLLDVGRITQGKVALEQTTLDLVALVRDAVVAVRPIIEARRHRVELALPSDAVVVHGDPARLLQIVENLLTNAAKYTPPDGRIQVRVARDGASAQLAISDSGVGIAAEHLENIFGLFTQLDSSLDRSERGLGVGLSMVRMLTEMHGGKVCAESDGPGRGSRFTVSLPAYDAQPAAGGDDGASRAAPSVKVLIVEDIADSRKILRRLLALDGHDVREAADGQEGLHQLLSDPPDVALIDVGLPGIDGYEVARRARQQPLLAKVRLVALTGYGRPEDRKAVLEAGFDEHLVKPVGPAELARVLKPRE
jgi:signal transduction histidine kinase/CheY-like chemotaxis protein